jgi:hypothetical protein
MLSRVVEDAIRDAIERGEIDQLVGAGQPVDLSAYFETPEELRLAYSMFQNAGLLPEEVELVHQISAFQEQARLAADWAERPSAAPRHRDLRLKFGVRMDGLRRERTAKQARLHLHAQRWCSIRLRP